MDELYDRGEAPETVKTPDSSETPVISQFQRVGAISIAITYGIVVVTGGLLADRLGGIRIVAVTVAVLPGLIAIAAGLPKVIRARPLGLMILFHLIAYPMLATLTIGSAGAFVAWRASLIVSG